MAVTSRALKQRSVPRRAVEAIKSSLSQGQTFLRTDATMVLVCGKCPSQVSPGGRDRILAYAHNHLKKFQFFIAEDVFELLSDNGLDLLSIQDRLSGFCDCVIIVLESESTYAELGAFAMKAELAEKLLVINDENYRTSRSFISLGPLAKVDRVSRFRPVIHADLKSILTAGPQLDGRLSAIERFKNKRIALRNWRELQSVAPKIRMLFLLDLITFFQPISHKEIIEILMAYYGKQDFAVGLELHLLVALGLTKRSSLGHYYYRPSDSQRLSFAYHGVNEVSVRSDVLNHYHKYSRKKVEILRAKVSSLL